MPGPIFSPDRIESYAADAAKAPSSPSDFVGPVQPTKKKGAGFGPYAAIALGNAADLGTSLWGEKVGLHEANPLIFDHPSLYISKAVSALAQMGAVKMLSNSGHPTAAKVVGYASGAIPGLVAGNNYRLIRQKQRENE